MFCIFAFSAGEPHALINRSGPWPWKGSFHPLWLAYTSRYKWPAPKLAPAANDMVAANKRQNTRHGYMKNGQIQLNFGSFLFRRLKIFKISTMLAVSGTLRFKNFLWKLTSYWIPDSAKDGRKSWFAEIVFTPKVNPHRIGTNLGSLSSLSRWCPLFQHGQFLKPQ